MAGVPGLSLEVPGTAPLANRSVAEVELVACSGASPPPDVGKVTDVTELAILASPAPLIGT